MRISDWSSDVCSSDLQTETLAALAAYPQYRVVAPGKLDLAELQQVLRGDEAYLKMLVVGDAVYAMLIGPSDARLSRADIGAAGLDRAVDAIRLTISAIENGRRGTSDRKRVVEGKRVSVSVEFGGRRRSKKKNRN